MRMIITIEFRRRDSSHPDLLDQKPAKLEIPSSLFDMFRKGVIAGNLHLGQVHQDEVSAFGLGVLGTLVIMQDLSSFQVSKCQKKGGALTGNPKVSKTSQNNLILPFISC